MSDLRSLKFTAAATSGSTNYPQEFLIYHNATGSALNGGCCLLWSAPAGTTFITFEIWGGGGSGGNSCCCVQGDGGGAGAYSVKTICSATLAGCAYTICAGGSSGCSQSTVGCSGFTSFVTGPLLSNFCAAGGGQGCSDCFKYWSCYQCRVSYCCACANGGDINLAGFNGEAIQTQFCGMWGQGHSPTSPATASGPMVGAHGCQWGGGQGWPCAMFPGGGGHSAIAPANTCCYSGIGAGGLVSVTYG